jgi:hypothetical protein
MPTLVQLVLRQRALQIGAPKLPWLDVLAKKRSCLTHNLKGQSRCHFDAMEGWVGPVAAA